MRRVVFAAACVVVLLSTSVSATDNSPRVVTIEVLIDHGDDVVRAHQAISSAVLDVSGVFRREFNIEFKVVVVGSWRPASQHFDGNEAFSFLENAGHNRSDIVVAFTSRSFFADVPEETDSRITVKRTSGGLAKLGGNHAIVRLYDRANVILIHEIAHLFMAQHSDDPGSVMYGDAIAATAFDEDSKEAVFQNRDRKF